MVRFQYRALMEKEIWISAEMILDTITWSKIPDSFSYEEKIFFKAYHDGKLIATECCDKLKLKHSYYFSADGAIRQELDSDKVSFCISA